MSTNDKPKRSTAKSGHAVNAANFESIIIILTNLGAAYNPSQPLIMLSALNDKLAALKTAVVAKDTAEAVEANDTNDRAEIFADIGKLSTKIKLAAEVNVNDEAFVADLQTLNRQMNGMRAAAKPVVNPETPNVGESPAAISVSQQSFDDLQATFGEIIARLKSRPDYTPNEPEVKITTLETRHAAMASANNQAKTSIAAAQTARQTRDEILYNETDGVLKLVKLIKSYIKQQFSKGDPTYDAIMAMQFKKAR